MLAAHPWRRQLDLVVAVRVLPLQAFSLLLLPLPWTLPRLFALLVANPVAVVEGVRPSPSPYLHACAVHLVIHQSMALACILQGPHGLHVRIARAQAARLTRCLSARVSWRSRCTGRLWCHTWG